MLKYTILGRVNVLTGLLYCYLLALGISSIPSFPSLVSSWSSYLHILIWLGSACLCAWLIYKLFYKKEKHNFKKYLILTIAPIIWLLITFLGFFAASSLYFPILVIFSVAAFLLWFRKTSMKLTALLSISTLFISAFVIVSAFEEDYCWKKGDQATAGKQDAMVIATEQDAKALKSWDVKPGQQIGVSFRTHMLCHQSFNLNSALQDSYLSIK